MQPNEALLKEFCETFLSSLQMQGVVEYSTTQKCNSKAAHDSCT